MRGGPNNSMQVHPSCLPEEELLKECSMRHDRRGGPGGQHRNKVETAVIVLHASSGITAEASERRSQVDNRRVAIWRLRLALAVQHRSEPLAETPSPLWRQRTKQGRMDVSEQHADFPCLLAELLDRLHILEYALPACGEFFELSSSQLVKLLRKWPPALAHVNARRAERELRKLA